MIIIYLMNNNKLMNQQEPRARPARQASGERL